MSTLRILLLQLLIPLSYFYGFIIAIRNFLYNISFFQFVSFDIPIISVGNITTGGTGKTPMVIYLAKLLESNGFRPGIVSRVYGRNSKGIVMVHDGNSLLTDVYSAGDEPFLMGKELNTIPLIVSENRTAGIKELLDKCSVDVVVLDDAFQHRSVGRNMDMVMISAYDNLDDYHILPWGKLRDSINGLKRAQCVIYTKTTQFQNPPIHKILKPYLMNSPTASIMKSMLMKIDETGYHKTLPIDEPVFAFCGIANPTNFIQTVKEMGLKITGELIFQDHQKYNKQVLQDLSVQVQSSNCRAVVTTEKDMVKIPEPFMKKFMFYVIKINVVFENDSDIIDLIKPVFLPAAEDS